VQQVDGDFGPGSRSLPGETTASRMAVCDRYNAALQAATAALAAAGYRATRDNHHYRVIRSPEVTTAPSRKFIDAPDGSRKKRSAKNRDVFRRTVKDVTQVRLDQIY